MWQKLTIAVVAGLILSAAGVLAKSDWPPWASVGRVDDLRSDVLTGDIDLKWNRYCAASDKHNREAVQGISEDIQGLQIQYARLNAGREVPLRPCP